VAIIQRFLRGFIMGLWGFIGGFIALSSVILMGIVAVALFIEMIFGELIRIKLHDRRIRAQMKNNYRKYHPPRGWHDGARRLGL